MASRHEAPKPKIPEIHFAPEGYIDPDDIEFLEQLLAKLEEQGIPAKNLVYTGLDGKYMYAADGSLQRPEALFGMNETGWRETIKNREVTPAGYVKKDADIPIIALFDGSQLMEPKTYRLVQDPTDDWAPVKIEDINPGREADQKPIDPNDKVDEVVIHRDYPNASPADALVALVYIEEENYNPTHDHGL